MRQLLAKAAGVFDSASEEQAPVDLRPLQLKFRSQALEISFLERTVTKAGLPRVDKLLPVPTSSASATKPR
jgi:hypothetical protein